VRAYFENLYLNKLDNLEEMDKFLDAFDLQIEPNLLNLNRTITSKEIKAVRVSQQRKAQDQMDLLQISTTPLKN
jgi:hypothetical protein